MDPLSEEDEMICSCEGGGDFPILDNGDMIISVVNRAQEWGFWLLSYDDQGALAAEKIWETDLFEFVDMLEFNSHGLFFIGSYYYDAGDGLYSFFA